MLEYLFKVLKKKTLHTFCIQIFFYVVLKKKSKSIKSKELKKNRYIK